MHVLGLRDPSNPVVSLARIGAQVAHARRVTLLEAMAAQPPGSETLRLCTTLGELLDAAGVALTIAVDGLGSELAGSTPLGARLAELEFTFGEGPAASAHHDGVMVEIPDTAHELRWPVFSPAAARLGIRSVMAFPVRRGAIRLGALSVAWTDLRRPTEEEIALAATAARLALDLLLTADANPPASEREGFLDHAATQTAAIHQASGMVAAQLGVAVGTALALLRARAYADDRELTDIAQAVLDRQLRYQDEP